MAAQAMKRLWFWAARTEVIEIRIPRGVMWTVIALAIADGLTVVARHATELWVLWR